MTGDLAVLRPLLGRLNDLKRIRLLGRSLTTCGFQRAWVDLVTGSDPAEVARRETAAALAAVELCGITPQALERAGMSGDRIADTFARAVEMAGAALPDAVRIDLRGRPLDAWHDTPHRDSVQSPCFISGLISQPRAGATHPTKPRLILEPAESHADHCYMVAVVGFLLAAHSGSDPVVPFLAGLAHHLHNAVLADAGFAGEALLVADWSQMVEKLTADALDELPPTLAAAIRSALHKCLPSPETPAGSAFHAADVIDRVLEVVYYDRVSSFRLATALDDLELVHPGPFKTFQDRILAEAGLAAKLLVPISPTTGRLLRAENPHTLSDGVERWPVVASIAYLRTGREELRREVLGALDSGDGRVALALLLADQDPFAPLPPPDHQTLLELIDATARGAMTLREAMRVLNFGPVADYFAVRTSSPTFLSGLGLLSQCRGRHAVVEVACGIGQLLREPYRRDVPVAGIDLVFSKLWLAHTFVVPHAQLICGDACGPLAESMGEATVLCHDAFYFFADKPAAATALMRLAGPGGRVLVGHVHNAHWNHGVAGHLLSPQGYASLFPECVMFDDAAFTTAHLNGTPAPSEHPTALGGVEAVSLVWPAVEAWGDVGRGPPDSFAIPVEGTHLVLNPLLIDVGGRLGPHWPSPRVAEEYRFAEFLCGEPLPSREVLAAAASGLGEKNHQLRPPTVDVWSEVGRLARKRILVPKEDCL